MAELFTFISHKGQTIKNLSAEAARLMYDSDKKAMEEEMGMQAQESAKPALQQTVQTAQAPLPKPAPSPAIPEPQPVSAPLPAGQQGPVKPEMMQPAGTAQKFATDMGASIAASKPAWDITDQPRPDYQSKIRQQVAESFKGVPVTKETQEQQTAMQKEYEPEVTRAGQAAGEDLIARGVGQFNDYVKSNPNATSDDLREKLSNLQANISRYSGESKTVSEHPALKGLEEQVKAKGAVEKTKSLSATGGFGYATRTKIAERNALIAGVDPYHNNEPLTPETKDDAWTTWEKTWATGTQLQTEPKYISAAGRRAGTTTRAKLAPDIVGAEAGKAAAASSARMNQTKVDAASAANALLAPYIQENGELALVNKEGSPIPPNQIGELFVASAKLLNQQGQLSDETINLVSQPTFKQDVAKMTQYFGKQFGGATTEQVLMNLYHLIQREGSQAGRAVSAAESGKAQSFKPLTPETSQQYQGQGAAPAGAPDQFGFTVGQSKYSKKLGRNLTYMGDDQWQ